MFERTPQFSITRPLIIMIWMDMAVVWRVIAYYNGITIWQVVLVKLRKVPAWTYIIIVLTIRFTLCLWLIISKILAAFILFFVSCSSAYKLDKILWASLMCSFSMILLVQCCKTCCRVKFSSKSSLSGLVVIGWFQFQAVHIVIFVCACILVHIQWSNFFSWAKFWSCKVSLYRHKN